MNLCIPVSTQDGLNSQVFGHFGSAPWFLITDPEGHIVTFIRNHNEHHNHGTCQPLKALEGHPLDVVLCRGMGARAVEKLMQGGLEAWQTSSETARESLAAFREGRSIKLTPENACHEHDGCS